MKVLMDQIIGELLSPTASTFSFDFVSLCRQLGLVSLHFFLKYIAGAFNPYNLIDDDLHLDMCNFRQSKWCLEDGAKAAGFVFRGGMKSTIFTHGGAAWELVRSPDEAFLFMNAKADRAHEWKWTVQRVFDSNALFAGLYPECVPAPTADRWNNKEMVVPHRTRFWKEPSIAAAGVEGAKEGDHPTVIAWDDLIGLDALDVRMSSAAMMETADKTFATNYKTLPRGGARIGRNLVWATFYATDDLYVRRIARNCKQVFGFKNDEIEALPEGEWTIYYRSIVENGRETCPSVMTADEYERLLIDDRWTAIRHYKNSIRPIEGAGGIPKARILPCSVVEREGRKFILRKGDVNFDERSKLIALDTCAVILQVDPAGTESNITSQTSRSSAGVTAKDDEDNVYRLWEKVGYMSDTDLYESVFEAHDAFPGYIQLTCVESNAMQVLIVKHILRMMEKRRRFFALEGKSTTGSKPARIRHKLGPYLSTGRFYAATGCAKNIAEELAGFPGSKHMDVLDEQALAVDNLFRPPTDVERFEIEADDELRQADMVSASAADSFGY